LWLPECKITFQNALVFWLPKGPIKNIPERVQEATLRCRK